MNLIKLAVVTLALPNLYGGHLGGLIYKTKIKSFPWGEATGHRPTATGHRPATTTSQHPRPPATGQRPATTSQHPRPPATGQRPPATGQPRRPASIHGHRPTATGQRPPATGQPRRPASIHGHRPTATGQRPPATGQPQRPASIHAHRPPATGHRPTGHRPPATRAGQDKISQSPHICPNKDDRVSDRVWFGFIGVWRPGPAMVGIQIWETRKGTLRCGSSQDLDERLGSHCTFADVYYIYI